MLTPAPLQQEAYDTSPAWTNPASFHEGNARQPLVSYSDNDGSFKVGMSLKSSTFTVQS
jgi:hypothetical protein